MVKDIVRDTFFLGRKSSSAGPADVQVIADLKDTLRAHHDTCAGMAANMIGCSKDIIIIALDESNMIMVNPVILRKSEPYDTQEGCLSLDGVRRVRRFDKITVRYEDESFEQHTEDYSEWTAQIIQHECDHLKGIII